MRDYYHVLNVPRTASAQDIRAAHRALARRYHPDTADDGQGDPRQFSLVQEAYETLSIADHRRRYDLKQAADRGEISDAGRRRPPKSPCGVCATPVYASQLKLYLGRYMCKSCFDNKRVRYSRRMRLGRATEMLWQLKRLRVWAQSHLAAVVIVALALGAAGARVAWVTGRSRALTPAETSPNTQPSDSNPCMTTPKVTAPKVAYESLESR